MHMRRPCLISIVINKAEHALAIKIVKHKYMLRCKHKIRINIMLCSSHSTAAEFRFQTQRTIGQHKWMHDFLERFFFFSNF